MVRLSPDNERIKLCLRNTCFACLVEVHGYTVSALIDLRRPKFDQHRQSVIEAMICHQSVGIAEMPEYLGLVLLVHQRWVGISHGFVRFGWG